jgi:hypothetical protein
MLEIEYHPEARLEALEARQWYSEIDEQVGKRFKIELARSEGLVQRNPDAWGRYLHGSQAFRFKGFPFKLVYLNLEQQIIVIALVHDRRRPGYWKHRLKS